jgi:hypothetical protein
MIAWLDSTELKRWWKADSAIVEPFHGGMFYLAWGEQISSKQHAIFGVVDKVDTDHNIIEVTKIMYITPTGKMGHLHLHVSFEKVCPQQTKINIIHSHNYSGEALRIYKESVYASWPKSFALLKKFLEQK